MAVPYLSQGMRAECRVAAQEKARQLRRALVRGEHEVLRNAKPEHCLPKAQGRQLPCGLYLTLTIERSAISASL